ncbi:hypothetical protein TTRE_0000101101 [Trichuris trichiura]|uniref:Uncharacterized protein n=1 Tax=Trichuris trichiura TaxID=36087 RepID=A0A077YYE7_TRITR|nr:hypothetical protein TTRE_0000101101 [Trichuris trichiura]
MKFDAIRGPRELVYPSTATSAWRSCPYRSTFCKNPFLGVYFTLGFVVFPYLFHKLDKKLGIEEGRKRMLKERRERKMERIGGEEQFLRDYEYLKHHLLKQWEKEEK